MKKVFTVLFLAVSALAFGDTRLLPVKEEPVFVAVQDSLTFTFDRGLEGNTRFVSSEVAVDWYPFSLGAGFQTGGHTFDAVASASWFPLYSQRQTTSWHFGLESIFHVQDYHGIETEKDFVSYFCVRWLWYSGFQLDVKTGFHIKSARIYVLEETLYNYNPALYVGVSKRFDFGLELYSSACSHGTYRYQLFLEPHWIFGLGWYFPKNLYAAVECELVNTDYLASAFYMHTGEIRLVGRVQL